MKLRWFQFNIRTMLILLATCAALFAVLRSQLAELHNERVFVTGSYRNAEHYMAMLDEHQIISHRRVPLVPLACQWPTPSSPCVL